MPVKKELQPKVLLMRAFIDLQLSSYEAEFCLIKLFFLLPFISWYVYLDVLLLLLQANEVCFLLLFFFFVFVYPFPPFATRPIFLGESLINHIHWNDNNIYKNITALQSTVVGRRYREVKPILLTPYYFWTSLNDTYPVILFWMK